MKRLIFILIIFLISGCSVERKDFYNLSIDEYKIVVGYDDLNYLKNIFEIKENEIMLLNKHFADFSCCDNNGKDVINDMIIHINDFGSIYKIDNIELSKSIKENCKMFNGEYIYKKTKACIIQKQVNKYTNSIILSGDLLNDDLDELKTIRIQIK